MMQFVYVKQENDDIKSKTYVECGILTKKAYEWQTAGPRLLSDKSALSNQHNWVLQLLDAYIHLELAYISK